MKALVTGGTGTLGRLVVPRLQAAGFDVRVLSRHSQEAAAGVEFMTGDLATGQGIEAAVAGTGIILHLAGGMKGNGRDVAPGSGIAGRDAASCLHLGRRRGQDPDHQRHRSRDVRLLRFQACSRAGRG